MHRDPEACAGLAAAEEVPEREEGGGHGAAILPRAAHSEVLLAQRGIASWGVSEAT